jgi:hypothetical protein
MKPKILVSILTLFLIFSIVNAVGINPGITQATYVPGGIISGNYSIYNKETVEKTYTLTPQGSLADYLELPETQVTIPANGVYPTNFSLTMPEGLAPGRYDTRIHITEPSKQGGFGLAFAIEYVIVFDVLYQGKHLSSSIMLGGQATDNLIVALALINDGSEAVNSSQIKVTITDSAGKELFSKTENTGAVDVGKTASTLMQTNKTEWVEGNYTLKIGWNYDGKSDSVSKEFNTEEQAPLPVTTTTAPLQTQTAQQQSQGNSGLTVGGTTGDIMFYVIVGVLALVIVALLAVVIMQRRRA